MHGRELVPFFRRLAVVASAIILAAQASGLVVAEDAPTFQIDMKDGVVTPQRLEIPAGRRVLIEITNSGSGPAEFESRDLKKEIGLFPGKKGTLVIKRLDPGEYAFFDDFHPGAAVAVIIAK